MRSYGLACALCALAGCARLCGEETVVYDFTEPSAARPRAAGEDPALAAEKARFGAPRDTTPEQPPQAAVKVPPPERPVDPHDASAAGWDPAKYRELVKAHGAKP